MKKENLEYLCEFVGNLMYTADIEYALMLSLIDYGFDVFDLISRDDVININSI